MCLRHGRVCLHSPAPPCRPRHQRVKSRGAVGRGGGAPPRLSWVASIRSLYSTPRLPPWSWTVVLRSVLNPPDKSRRRAGVMMAAEPFKSALINNSGEDTSLALPSDNNLRTGHQRVKDQVHSIKRSKSKSSKNGGISPVSPTGVYGKASHIALNYRGVQIKKPFRVRSKSF